MINVDRIWREKKNYKSQCFHFTTLQALYLLGLCFWNLSCYDNDLLFIKIIVCLFL